MSVHLPIFSESGLTKFGENARIVTGVALILSGLVINYLIIFQNPALGWFIGGCFAAESTLIVGIVLTIGSSIQRCEAKAFKEPLPSVPSPQSMSKGLGDSNTKL